MKKMTAILLAVLGLLAMYPAAAGGESSGIETGDVVLFGLYPQDDGTDETFIEWIVLDVRDGKALLLSQYGLDVKPFHTEGTGAAWETCTLRAWLNHDFLNTAFSPDGLAAILVTGTDENGTEDQVFLLSREEAERFLGVNGGDRNNTGARIQPTPYALERGALTSADDQTENGADAGSWWLRSPGLQPGSTACVAADGSMDERDARSCGLCVRPALWVDLNLGLI